MSTALVILSIVKQDGFALLATILLSFLSTLIGVGSRWRLDLMKRRSTRNVPKDQIVIYYPNGSFRIIKCEESIARELYWHPEACNYTFSDTTYRLISLVGTITLMVGVVCLANSTLPLQVAYAGAYLILNVLYWVVAALPPQWHWDLSCYEVTQEFYEGGEANETFTNALWKAIAVTQSVEWVKLAQVAPVSEGWKKWVDMAEAAVYMEKERSDIEGSAENEKEDEMVGIRPLPHWDPEKALTECLNPDPATRNV